MEDGTVRSVLLRHSDAHACRVVFAAETGDGTAEVADYVEAVRVTGGALCLVAAEGAMDWYVRSRPRGFEALAVWPPWSAVEFQQGLSRAETVALLADLEHLRTLPHDDSPFVHEDVLDAIPGLSWP